MNRFFLLLLIFIVTFYGKVTAQIDSASVKVPVSPVSVLADSLHFPLTATKTIATPIVYPLLNTSGNIYSDSILKFKLDSIGKEIYNESDYFLFSSNPLLAPLVFKLPPMLPIDGKKKDIMEYWNSWNDSIIGIHEPDYVFPNEFIAELRQNFLNKITRENAALYHIAYDNLPDVGQFKERLINYKPIDKVVLSDKTPNRNPGKIMVDEVKKRYWQRRLRSLFQFSESYISDNWYQGGNSNLAALSILSGQLNYDNAKNIQWENALEWRAGFNSVEGDTIRKISTNDDLLRLISKFGVKAFGNWYYSISSEASTQVFDNYKGINSTVYQARLFTPVRVNVGVGMDYKYKKLFSLMVAPVSYKYIYVRDTANVNPNLFGIEKGKNQLSELGSSLRAQLSYSPYFNWQIDSKLTFFTNYKKVETDLEIVNNFIINKFLSTRLLINPRYDNTVIMKGGEKAKIQFKQLLSIGLSFRIL